MRVCFHMLTCNAIEGCLKELAARKAQIAGRHVASVVMFAHELNPTFQLHQCTTIALRWD